MYEGLIRRGWWVFLPLFLGLGGAAVYTLRDFTIDSGTSVLLDDADPDLGYYNQSRADWGYDEYTIVCVHRNEWFTPEGILLLNEFTDALSKLPWVESVTAINTLPLLRNQPPKRTLFGAIPAIARLRDPGCDLRKARAELLGHTQAVGNLISADGKDLSILVYLRVPEKIRRLEPEWSRLQGRNGEAEARRRLAEIRDEYEEGLRIGRERRAEQVAAIRKLCAEWKSRFDEPIRLSGLPIINLSMIENVASDLKTFGILAAAMFVLGFGAVFRKIRWTVLPILTCLLPVAIAMGIMTVMGKRMTVISSNMPVLLFVLMLPYTVYFIERYRERRVKHPHEPGLTSTMRAAEQIWWPCFFSATTTMAGVASLLTSGINPIRVFGLMMTVGIGIGLLTVFLFLPACVRPLRALRPASPPGKGPLRFLAGLSLKAPSAVILLSLSMLGVSIWGTTKLDPETKFIDYFRKNSEVFVGLDYIDNRMGGLTPLEVILRSPTKGFFKTNEGLAAIEAVQKYFPRVKQTGSVRSLRTLIDEVKKFSTEFKVRGWDDQGTLQRLLLVGKDQVREFCNEDFTVSRVLVRFRETDPDLNRKEILDGLKAHLENDPLLRRLRSEKKLAAIRPTGVFLLYSNMLQSLLRSLRETFVMVLVVIYVMLVLLFRSPILALLVLVPQVTPVFVVLGTMGFLGIHLDMVTTMIAAVAMGVGIDGAIQYAFRFRKELHTAGTREGAILRTHATIGRAVGVAGAIVFCGFAVLMFSRFMPTFYFGLFTGLALLMGLFASLTTLPSLFVLLRYPRIKS